MNERAPLTLRANRLKTTRDALIERLAKEGVEGVPTPYSPDGIVVQGRINLFTLASFKQGLFEIQDEGSQLLSLLLDPRPGWLAVDACAGAGGKTLGLAASMRNKGRIVALDRSAVDAVEGAFAALATKAVAMPPIMRIDNGVVGLASATSIAASTTVSVDSAGFGPRRPEGASG